MTLSKAIPTGHWRIIHPGEMPPGDAGVETMDDLQCQLQETSGKGVPSPSLCLRAPLAAGDAAAPPGAAAAAAAHGQPGSQGHRSRPCLGQLLQCWFSWPCPGAATATPQMIFWLLLLHAGHTRGVHLSSTCWAMLGYLTCCTPISFPKASFCHMSSLSLS